MRFGFVRKLALILLLAVLIISLHTTPPIVRARGGAIRRVNVPYFSGDIAWALQTFP